MPRTTLTTFNGDRYIHRSERFDIIKKWFRNARITQFPSIRDFILKSQQIINAMPIRDNSGFHTEFNSSEIPYLLFLESQIFLNRSLSNFLAQICLHKAGFLSWAVVTNYYSSHFSLSGLLRLQGKARISTHGNQNLPRGFFVSISSPVEPKCVVFENWKNHHVQICSDFKFAYRNFDLFQNSFQDLYSLNFDDLLNEIELRNAYNYSLEEGFREILSSSYRRPDLWNISAYRLQSLPQKVTEPDFVVANMARAVCRIILLATTSWKIAKDSNVLKHLFKEYADGREKLITNGFGNNSSLSRCLLRFVRGRMRLT